MQKEIQDPVLGTLNFDEEYERYQTTIDWDGIEIELNFPMDDKSVTLDDLLPTAYILFKEQKEWDQRIRQYAAGELLELKNSTWLEEDEKELTPDDFMQRITPERLEVNPDEKFIMYFDDGDIFWGHGVEVWGELQKGPTSADMT